MKIKSIAAVGALGLGMGIAGLVAAGTASAQPEPPPNCGEAPIGITPGNIICNVASQAGTFAESISPQRNIGILLFGEADENGVPSGLGLVDQPTTFINSIVGTPDSFLSGPKSPDAPSQPAAPHLPSAPGP